MAAHTAESPLPKDTAVGLSVDSGREPFPSLPSVSSPAADDPASAPSSTSPLPLPSPNFLVIPGAPSPLLTAPTPIPPPFPSPSRQHRRTPSQQRLIRETLDAVSNIADDDNEGSSYHKINQYTIKESIGHGSFGEVKLATDQYGKEYAVKQFSKLRLRRRARTLCFKQTPFRADRLPRTGGPSPAAARIDKVNEAEKKDALHLIREEIAIMKKLNHPNLVELIEVLDDPEQDHLYMVMEMCKKGAIMDVDLEKTATPYDAEHCRLYFRDLILGIEYLHAQNIIHRDIKPANLLVTEDDILKIGDFGVSEIFEMPDRMLTSKNAGSPAFQPPELCVAKHGEVAGPPCDIWAMGITLFCLRYGRLPFYAEALEIYDAIKNNKVELPPDEDEHFVDLINRLLEKDPAKRITMAQVRDHPWVTLSGTDPLLSAEENCAEPVEPPNELELSRAFTRKMGHLLCVMKAIGKFKSLLYSRSRPSSLAGPAFTKETAYLRKQAPPSSETPENSVPIQDQVKHLLEERRKNSLKVAGLARQASLGLRVDTPIADGPEDSGESGAGAADAADAGGVQTPFVIGIGIGGGAYLEPDEEQSSGGIVSESPTSTDFDVYQSAFEMEMERIQRQSKSNPATVYMNSLVERRGGVSRWQAMAARATSRAPERYDNITRGLRNGPSLASIVAQAMDKSKA